MSKYQGYENLSGYYYNSLRRGAEVRGFKWDLDKEWLWNLYIEQEKKCKMSGLDIFLDRSYGRNRKGSKGEKVIQTASLDRIDSSRGYLKDNVQWVHKAINLLKMDLDQEIGRASCRERV